MTFMEMMEKEIRSAGKALTINEALELAEKDGSIAQIPIKGKTPKKTIYSLLYKDVNNGEKARFIQTSSKPAKYDLKYLH